MNLEKEILKEHSKRQTTKIVRWVGNNQKRFDELLKLFFTGENIVRQRGGWPLSYCAMKYPELAKPNLKKFLERLKKKNLHDAEKRNIVRLLQEIDLPENLQGLAAKVLFPLISSADETVAVKCFAMTTLARICKKHSELANELKMIVEEQLPYSTGGFKSRAKRTFKELNLA